MRFRKPFSALASMTAPCVEGDAQVMGDGRGDVVPFDEFGANNLVSYAVHRRCRAAQIWQLRNLAARYQARDDNAHTASIPAQRG